jgi:oxygen-independent coproporphyrinogen-3 oxidase
MSLETLLRESPYSSYSYSYPHKTAYRRLEPSVALQDAWSQENRDALFLYLHLPFCEMRCGFCNLFTTVERTESAHSLYLAALERQAQRVGKALGKMGVARVAIGGGTPTILAPDDLHRLFDVAEKTLGTELGAIPLSIETSPATATPERLMVLKERGATRVSIGVQSFLESETKAVGRPQRGGEVHAALQRIHRADFPIFNLDLMYGLPGQTRESWLYSLQTALDYDPEEIYLYPLYVRPLTGLGHREDKGLLQREGDTRLELYRAGRDFLLEKGYRQISMRMFQSVRVPSETGPLYCCQEDGMLGLGCGARSYTQKLHYSGEWAVGASGVKEILADYLERPETSFDVADYGFKLDEEEQRRRYLLQSLLQSEGLDLLAYEKRFASDAFYDVPQLVEIESLNLGYRDEQFLRLNADGLEKSDAIGPWLASTHVREQMEGFAWR